MRLTYYVVPIADSPPSLLHIYDKTSLPHCSTPRPTGRNLGVMGSEKDVREDVQGQVLNETLNGLASREDAEAVAACVICLSEISEACTAKPCAHNNFDFLCLASWLQQKTSCPLCKAEVTEIQYDFTDGGSSKTYRVPKIGLQSGSTSAPQELRHTLPPNQRSSGRGQPSRGNFRHGRRAFQGSTSDPDVRARGVLARRRQVYRDHLLSLHVGSNSTSRYKDITLRQLQSDQDLLSRARTFIRRELQVFEFLNDDSSEGHSEDSGVEGAGRRRRRQNNAVFVLEYVIAILKTVDIQESSGHAENLLSDFLGRENAQVFLHELRSFLRSPFSIEAWDKNVQYDESKAATSRSNSRDGSEAVGRQYSGRPRQTSDRYRPRRFEERSRDSWARRQPRGPSRIGATDSWRPG
ncbi:hypothetical protein N0V82_010135 [Gnomoniopsis sp. IMI 355080]|nr:hypothetical protein N0V82_010135 [Gnomoniopsis sp. IMI 355080]